jgi:DNA-3-methyladenine glycosylase
VKRSFYARPCLEVAERLIGAYLVVGARVGRIVETEAYVSPEDLACHARFGPAGRAAPLFGPPGHAYVYLIYGMYDCFNVVTEPAGRASAVLVRALEPIAGLDGQRTNGPGRLTRALGITRAHNRLDLVAAESPIRIEPGPRGRRSRVITTPRIGIDYAGEWAARPFRFVDAESRFLSRRLPGKMARRSV